MARSTGSRSVSVRAFATCVPTKLIFSAAVVEQKKRRISPTRICGHPSSGASASAGGLAWSANHLQVEPELGLELARLRRVVSFTSIIAISSFAGGGERG